MKLAIEQFTWNDLHDTERLADLSRAFDRFIERHDAPLFARFDAYRGAVANGIAPFDDAIVHRERVESPEGLAREAAALHALVDLLVDWIAAKWKAGAFDGWTSFRLPRPLIFDKLVPTERIDDLRFGGVPHEFRKRDGFKLTDSRFTPRQIADEANYCIFCHERKKDSCSHG